MDDSDYVHDPDYQNFVSVYRGFSYVGKVLEPYTRYGLKNVHQHIYTKLAGCPTCSEQCSSKQNKWCHTCKNWRDLLQRSGKTRGIDSSTMKSWEWPTNYECIIGVFLPKEWSNIDLQDISTACNIWSCCSEFKIRHLTTERVKRLRNETYGHNPNYRVTAHTKAIVFDALKDLINDPNVKGHVNVSEILNNLNTLEHSNQEQQLLENIRSGIASLSRQMLQRDAFEITQAENVNEIIRRLKSESSHRDASNRDASRYDNILGRKGIICRVVLIFLLILCFLYGVQYIYEHGFSGQHNATPSSGGFSGHHGTTPSSGSNCLSEKYTFPFRQDMELFGYIRDHKNLIGREWLFDDLENKLLNASFSKTGVIAIAEIGYGKSAIVSHLLCASNDEKGGKLREHTVAFHVCKFDVPSTHRPERFVRRLIGFLSLKSAEFGNIISMLDNSSIIFNLEQCGQEIEACFDQGVVLPFQKVKEMPGVPWIIVIDAIDECLNTKENKNAILELLSSRARKLPKWIKLLITSRNITQLAHLNKITQMSLKPNDQKNIKDVTLYIEHIFSQKGAELSSRTISERIDHLVHKSEGNFMYIRHALDYLMQKNENETSRLELPSTLGEIYELNFERQFGTKSLFQCPKVILEIICASLDPLSKHDIFKILSFDHVACLDVYNNSFDKLSYFINSDTSTVALVHQSIYEWLISEGNEAFHISLEKGHNLMSRYLFNAARNNRARDKTHDITNDIVSLAIHVAKSKDISLSKMFTSMKDHEYHLNYNESAIHRLIWTTDSVTALGLLLHFTHNVDALSRGGVTPAFIAASKGHIGQLKLLVKQGANKSFSIDDRFIMNIELLKKVQTVYLSGYGLLHIAAKNGHIEVVEYLLKWNKALLDIKTPSASEIACANGHIGVLEIIAQFKPNVYDDICLYYAAKGDHKTLIEKLVLLGVNAGCISNERSVFEMNKMIKNHGRITQNTLITYLGEENIHLLHDEWWILFKETALHVAVRVGNSAIVQLMIERFPEMLKCKDAFGRTPFLTSIFYNHTELFRQMLTTLSKDECGYFSAHIGRHPSYEYLHSHVLKNACPYGAKFTHLIALYGRSEMFSYTYDKRISVDWNEKDKNNTSPIHYAVCATNIFFLTRPGRLPNIDIDMTAKTNNGSSVYHLAALYSPMSFFALIDNHKHKIPELKDINNRSILHYLVMNELTGLRYIDDSNEHLMDMIIFKYLIHVCKHSITTRDGFGQNILHYAMRYGHGAIISYIWETYRNEFLSMIQTRNFEGYTPVMYALSNISITKHGPLVLHEHCPFYESFFDNCSASIDFCSVLTSFEYGIVFVLQTPQLRSVHSDISLYSPRIISSSPYLTTAALTFCNDMTVSSVNRDLLESLKLTPVGYSLFAIAALMPDVFRVCGKPFSKSPLHLIAFYVNHKYSMFSRHKDDVELALKSIFGNPLNRKIYSCGDKNGLNILHYALLGGNICTAKVLLAFGIKETNKFISVTDVLKLTIFARPVHDNTNYLFEDCLNTTAVYVDGVNQFTSTDHFLTEFILSHKNKFKLFDMCKFKSNDLSIVHLLAANGMVRTLQTIVETFGYSAILCTNVDGFTPLYFARFFNHSNIVNYFESEALRFPKDEAEEHFLLKSVYDFSPTISILDPLYCPKIFGIKNANWNIRKRRHLLNCITRFHLNKTRIYTFSVEHKLLSTIVFFTTRVFDCRSFLGCIINNKRINNTECAKLNVNVKQLEQAYNSWKLHVSSNNVKVSGKIWHMTGTLNNIVQSLFAYDSKSLNSVVNCSFTKRRKMKLRQLYLMLELTLDELLLELSSVYIRQKTVIETSKEIIMPNVFHFALERLQILKYRRRNRYFGRYEYLDSIKKILYYNQFRKFINRKCFPKQVCFELSEPKNPFEDLLNPAIDQN